MRLWQGRFATSGLSGYALVLPREALAALDLVPGQTVLLRAGHRGQSVWLQAGPRGRQPDLAWLSRPLTEFLPLPPGQRFWLRHDDDNSLRLGPVLGFLSLRSIYAGQRLCPYAGDQRFFADACRLASRTGGLAYVFGPDDIDWDTRTTRGYTYQARPVAGRPGMQSWRWAPGVFPLPDVVYNRILGRSRELSRPIREVEQHLRSLPGTAAFFNPGYFDKWHVNEVLDRDGEARRFLPATLQASPRHLRELLLSMRAVYVKPRAGFAGRGIMRVERLARDRYRVIRITGARAVGRVTTWSGVARLVGRKALQQPAIVQQAIELPSIRGRNFDLRAMVQKNERGAWRLTALVAKLASPGNITTHIRTGGEAQFVEPILTQVFGLFAAEVRQDVEAAVLTVAASLERGLGEELGELGMDVAVDREGRPWILEVNAKPGRKVFELNPVWNRTWLQGLVHYGGYRAGFEQDGIFAGAVRRVTRQARPETAESNEAAGLAGGEIG